MMSKENHSFIVFTTLVLTQMCGVLWGQGFAFENEGSVLAEKLNYPQWNDYGDGYFIDDRNGDTYSTNRTVWFRATTIGYGDDLNHSYVVFRHETEVVPSLWLDVTFAGRTTAPIYAAIEILVSCDGVVWTVLGSTPARNWANDPSETVTGFPELSGEEYLYVMVRPAHEPTGAAIYIEKVNIVGRVENSPAAADPDGPYLGAANTAIAFNGTGSSDPDGDTLTYDWDFGDGCNGTGDIPTHSYGSAGIYDVCLTVNDGTVNSPAACTIAVVYDASAGFVTGGGWIDSPAGAYVTNASLTGEASFGFVSKYKKGASIPTGNTAFVFEVADFEFHSSSYDWMIVNQGGTNAQFKGSGSINNAGDYRFMLWAGDGGKNDNDTFRMKIWEEDNSGSELVIYDNGVKQTIGGGSIVIHQK